jgi:hypothetical protein
MTEESSVRAMDKEYARLSLLAGYFAGQADQALGREHYIRLIREHAWCLTWEKLAMWKADAVQLGVPSAVLQPPPKRLVAEFVKKGMKMQEIVDR